jgi:DNA-binding response OmpR family regulator
VDCAGDGARADFLAQTERYDAVILDLVCRKSTASRSAALA